MSLSRFLADDKALVTYRPKLNAATGSVLGTIYLQQVLYWYEKAGRKPFYKFNAPCDHEAYQRGDSWQEEIGFSKSEFSTARRSISQKVRKGGKKDKSVLVWYWTDISRKTYYEVNIPKLDAILTQIYVNPQSGITVNQESGITVNPQSGITKVGNPDLDITETTRDYQETNTEKERVIFSCDDFCKAYGVDPSQAIERTWYGLHLKDQDTNAIAEHLPDYLKRTAGNPRFRKRPDNYLKDRLWEVETAVIDVTTQNNKVLPKPTGKTAYIN